MYSEMKELVRFKCTQACFFINPRVRMLSVFFGVAVLAHVRNRFPAINYDKNDTTLASFLNYLNTIFLQLNNSPTIYCIFVNNKCYAIVIKYQRK